MQERKRGDNGMKFYVDEMEFRKSMLEKGYKTIEALSADCGVNRNTIGETLSGKSRPSSTVIEKIAATLELSGADIGRIFFATKIA